MSADILIVDDEDDIRMVIRDLLEDEGYSVREAADSKAATAMVAEQCPDLVILDIWLEESGEDGVELLKKFLARHPGLPVIMISGHGNIETAVSTIRIGAYDYIEKPFKSDRLIVLAQRALETSQLRRENRELKLQAGGASDLVGSSPQIMLIRQSVEKVAPTGSRVLITGQPGVGKEVVARMIHRNSPRAEKPFVVLNCATMRPDRLEAELFGMEHDPERGGRKTGVLEQAHGGTLLLDEVSDMPLETQGKIVRVLQDQTFMRLGSAEPLQVDVRIIASSNRDLQECMAEGDFRQDLYYRLNVVPIHVPSLDERRSDIPDLAQFFMEQAASSGGMQPRAFAEDSLAVMQNYDWPGNVRQLRNSIEWLLIMSGGDTGETITADMLPPDITQETPDVMKSGGIVELMSKPLREAREIFEREYLLSQVNRFGGNISKTASFIGMERSALHRKLKSLGISTGEKERAEG